MTKQYLVKVPQSVRTFGVLAEPMTVVLLIEHRYY